MVARGAVHWQASVCRRPTAGDRKGPPRIPQPPSPLQNPELGLRLMPIGIPLRVPWLLYN